MMYLDKLNINLAREIIMECSPPLNSSEVFRMLLSLHRSYELCETRLRHRLDLNDTDLRAVNLLRAMQTPSSGQLARELGVSSAGITSVLDRLEARGLIERKRHPADRRRTMVAAGSRFPEATGPGQVLLRGVHKFYAQLDPPGRRNLAELLQQARTELDQSGTTSDENQATPDKSFQ